MVELRDITIQLEEPLDKALSKLSISLGRGKSDLIQKALIDWMEELNDIRDAEFVFSQGNPSVSLREVK